MWHASFQFRRVLLIPVGIQPQESLTWSQIQQGIYVWLAFAASGSAGLEQKAMEQQLIHLD